MGLTLTGLRLDAKWQKRVVLTCHSCGTDYEPKAGAACPKCGHTDDARECQACETLRWYTGS
jgi:rRNA maturation endonuclease Nob1